MHLRRIVFIIAVLKLTTDRNTDMKHDDQLNRDTLHILNARIQEQPHCERMNGSTNANYMIFAADRPYTVGWLRFDGESNTWQTHGGSRDDIGFTYFDAPSYTRRDDALADFRKHYDVAVKRYFQIEVDLLSIEPSKFDGTDELLPVEILFTDLNYTTANAMAYNLPTKTVLAILENQDSRFGLFRFHWASGLKWEVRKHDDAYSIFRENKRIALSHTKGQWH